MNNNDAVLFGPNAALYGPTTNVTSKESWEEDKKDLIHLFNLGLMCFNDHSKANFTFDDVIKTLEEEYGEEAYDHLIAMGNRFSDLNILHNNKFVDDVGYFYELAEIPQFLYSTVLLLMRKNRELTAQMTTINMLTAQLSEEKDA